MGILGAPERRDPDGRDKPDGFLGGDDFLSCRLSCAAADSGRLASMFNLTGRLAPRYSRCSHLDQAPCESCGISRFFSAATIFRLAVSLVAPVAAADASCLAWISDLTGRQTPRRPSSADRHQAPCKSRGISQFSRRRRFFSAATIFGLSRRPCRRHWCELPRSDFRSDWTAGTAAPEFRGPTSSAIQIARYFAIFSAATIFLSGDDFWPCHLARRPYRRHWCEMPRLNLGSVWTTSTAALVFRGLTSSAMQIARYLTILSAATRFLALFPPLSPPRGVKSPRAPLDARSSDFGISCVYEGHFKAEMRDFLMGHLRA